MIFVTVGTHEQQFNRLIECVDNMKKDGLIDEDVVMQIGYSTYEPKYCKWERLYSYKKMIALVEEARIVITHGGPSSFIMPLQIGKYPIVVPRSKKYDEHVNDHQISFVNQVSERLGTIIVTENVQKLIELIKEYDIITSAMKKNLLSNNLKFNKALEQLVADMFNK